MGYPGRQLRETTRSNGERRGPAIHGDCRSFLPIDLFGRIAVQRDMKGELRHGDVCVAKPRHRS